MVGRSWAERTLSLNNKACGIGSTRASCARQFQTRSPERSVNEFCLGIMLMPIFSCLTQRDSRHGHVPMEVIPDGPQGVAFRYRS